MKLLLTGYPGFLAKSIKSWFTQAGWEVDTLGRKSLPSEVDNTGQHLVCDLSQKMPQLPAVQYDLVIHAAGKAHVVPRTDQEKQAFYNDNVQGTENLLKALQACPPKSIIFISSVAVYGLESGQLITEDHPLKAEDPYGKSKILAEKLIRETVFTSEVKRIIVRLPLIMGKNAPGNLGSMISAIKKGFYFNIAGGNAERSVILKDDIAPYLKALADHEGTFNLTDQSGLTYNALYLAIRQEISCPRRPNLPYWFSWCLALAGEILKLITRHKMPFDMYRLSKMTHSLTFDGSKAAREINFTPRVALKNIKEIL